MDGGSYGRPVPTGGGGCRFTRLRVNPAYAAKDTPTCAKLALVACAPELQRQARAVAGRWSRQR